MLLKLFFSDCGAKKLICRDTSFVKRVELHNNQSRQLLNSFATILIIDFSDSSLLNVNMFCFFPPLWLNPIF